jgi:hypothetical protein
MDDVPWKLPQLFYFSRESRFAPNFIQNLYTVLKKILWESRSTPTLEVHLKIFLLSIFGIYLNFGLDMQSCKEFSLSDFNSHHICNCIVKHKKAANCWITNDKRIGFSMSYSFLLVDCWYARTT